MVAKIFRKTPWHIVINWQKKGVGFGQLSMSWDKTLNRFVLDSEMMNVDTVIEIFQALTPEEKQKLVA